MTELELLEKELTPKVERRRKLLPTWIKIFLWIFMVLGALAPLGILFGIMRWGFNLSLYGLETNQVFSAVGILLTILFSLKGMVSIGLWTEQDWAVDLAIIDAVFGIIACLFVMLVIPFLSETNFDISLRLELIVLIPYLIKMKKIKNDWKNIK